MMTPWSVDSEYGVLRDALLCRPDHYHWVPEANAVIQSTVAAGTTFDATAARRQHDELVAALQDAGVNCHFLEPDPHLPYQVYTRDSSLVTPWGAVLLQCQRPERRGEWYPALRGLREAGLSLLWAITAGPLEGGDIQILRPGLLLIGVNGNRSHQQSAGQLQGWFQERNWRVRLVPFPAHFLHLDLVFCMVAEKLALAFEEALDEPTRQWLDAEGIQRIPLSYRETMTMGGNVVALGNDRVLSSAQHPAVNQRLRAAGLTVYDPDLEMFVHEGGAAHCLTLALRRESVGGG